MRSRRFVTCYFRTYARANPYKVNYYNKYNIDLFHKNGKLYCEVPVYGIMINSSFINLYWSDKEKDLFVYDLSNTGINIEGFERIPGLHSFHVMVDESELQKRVSENEKIVCCKKHNYIR